MKKFIPPYIKHKDHPIVIRSTPHHNNAFYHCVKCQVWVGWLNKEEAKLAKDSKMIQN